MSDNSGPAFPPFHDPATHASGMTLLQYAMIHAPASEIALLIYYPPDGSFKEKRLAEARRAWATALIEESKR